jgi:PAS domain S-box-containing protein
LFPRVRDESYNHGESHLTPNERAESDDPIQLAVDAAEVGTWNWHIASGHVQWTPWTYQLFGVKPDVVDTSYPQIMQRVHAPDRPMVDEWISQAVQNRGRNTIEFRIDRPDGSIRWLRSTGRVMLNGQGEVVRMVGIVEDVTEEREHRSSIPTPPAGSPRVPGASFSARQVAHILGIADATVKRLAEAGNLKWLRSTRKNSRRFAPGDVVEYLRKGSTSPVDFESAAASQDVNGCLVFLLEQLTEGTPLEALLDERVRPAASTTPVPFLVDLLARLPFMVPERQRSGFPALFAQVGTPKHPDVEMIGCLLQAHGHEILRPAGALEPSQLAELAERVRARLLVLVVGAGPTSVQMSGLAIAGAIAAARSGATSVCVWSDDRLRVPRGLTRFRSMRELASQLRNF